MQIGGLVLVGSCIAPRYLCPPYSACCTSTYPHGSDIYCINDFAKTSREWRQVAVFKYAPHPLSPVRSDFHDRMRAPGGKIHCGAMPPVGGPDAADGDQSLDGKCRLGLVIGLMSFTISGPPPSVGLRILHETSQNQLGLGGVCFLPNGWQF